MSICLHMCTHPNAPLESPTSTHVFIFMEGLACTHMKAKLPVLLDTAPFAFHCRNTRSPGPKPAVCNRRRACVPEPMPCCPPVQPVPVALTSAHAPHFGICIYVLLVLAWRSMYAALLCEEHGLDCQPAAAACMCGWCRVLCSEHLARLATVCAPGACSAGE